MVEQKTMQFQKDEFDLWTGLFFLTSRLWVIGKLIFRRFKRNVV